MARFQIFLPDGSETVHELSEEATIVGRLPESGLRIEDDSVSSQHAEISFLNGAFSVRDLGSTNGTFLNGEKIEGATLGSGDEVRFGSIACVFSNDQAAIPAEEQEAPAEDLGITGGRRPENFVSTSPLPRNDPAKDPAQMILAACAVIGILAFAAGVFLILQPAT